MILSATVCQANICGGKQGDLLKNFFLNRIDFDKTVFPNDPFNGQTSHEAMRAHTCRHVQYSIHRGNEK